MERRATTAVRTSTGDEERDMKEEMEMDLTCGEYKTGHHIDEQSVYKPRQHREQIKTSNDPKPTLGTQKCSIF